MRFKILVIFVVISQLLLCSPNTSNEDSLKDSAISLSDNVSNNDFDSNAKNNSKNFINILKAFILNPLSSAILAAIITFIITNIYNQYKIKTEYNKNYKCLLITAQDEINFYKSKLRQLSAEADVIIESIRTNQPVVIPTYSLYPKFLEEIKFKLIKYSIDSDIIKEVSNCHFELSHIDERLNQLKTELRNDYNAEIQIVNVQGFYELLNSSIQVFEDTSSTIQRNKEK